MVGHRTKVRTYTCNCCSIICWSDRTSERTCKRSISEPSSACPSKKRKVMNATFQKWQRQYERDYQTLSWLRCELDGDKTHVASLYCEVCPKYEPSIQLLCNFSQAWMTGSTNLKCSNVIDHATSDMHKAAMAKKKADCAKASGRSLVLSSPIGRYTVRS